MTEIPGGRILPACFSDSNKAGEKSERWYVMDFGDHRLNHVRQIKTMFTGTPKGFGFFPLAKGMGFKMRYLKRRAGPVNFPAPDVWLYESELV